MPKNGICMNLKWLCLANGNPEEFLLFVQNYEVAFEASGELTENMKLQYLPTLSHGKM